MRRGFVAFSIILLFLVQITSNAQIQLAQIKDSNSIHEDSLFNQTGFNEDGVYTDSAGEVRVNRPHISWVTAAQGPILERTGACSVSIESRDEVWLLGGRHDPDPQQNNDEEATDVIEIMMNSNKSWRPSQYNLPQQQQYCESELVGDLVIVVGDWNRNSNPAQFPSGIVQIFNLSNNTWYNGSSMPSTNERGLGAMAEAGGYLYYAGGVRNPNANDATNRTYRYDPQTDQWSRMADMNQPRASFELINFHGQLYAMGGFQGTSSWNRQALDYVERYDPATDTWSNLSKLPVARFGWGGTVLNDEIVLVGGYNGGPKTEVYHWNPIEDTWSKGNDIGSIGHFDLSVEEINGSITWASGDMSQYAYSTWNQLFSQDSEFQNKSAAHTAWVTSPVIDLRPNQNGKALPVQFNLQGQNTPGGELGFQFRTSSSPGTISTQLWQGSDGTVNTTFTTGISNLDVSENADFVQYRIQFIVTDQDNWDEPDLDSIQIRSEHAAFVSPLPNLLHPRAETVHIQTSHDVLGTGLMYLEIASCDSFGSIIGQWVRLAHDGTLFSITDSQNMLISSDGTVNSSVPGETLIDWSFDLGDLTGTDYLCTKVGSSGEETIEFANNNPIEIDNLLEVSITGLGEFSNQDTVIGGIPINVGLNHTFPSTGMTLSSGDLQARINFNIQVKDAISNNNSGWVNQTTPWTNLTIGQTDIIPWTLPSDVSGVVNISIDARSDQSFEVSTNSSNSSLILDNENPVIIDSIPSNQDYLDSEQDRELSLLIGDVSGFNVENMNLQIWVEGMDDGSDGSFPDGIPQNNEYRDINFTLENDGSYWWFNGTQSDDLNEDQQLVYMRVVGDDLAGFETLNNSVWWKTRDARTSVVERIYNVNSNQFWEVSRDISWQIAISDSNALSDIMSVEVILGDSDQFGVNYDVADTICSSLGTYIDSDRSTCSHSFVDNEMIFSVTLFASWEVDLSTLEEGEVRIKVTDVDGTSSFDFENLWTFSDDFDFSIDQISDETGYVIGDITNDSILQTGDEIRIAGEMTHSLSGLPYEGELSLSWWGLLQGENWFGSSTIEVFEGKINTTITMPSNGGLMDFQIAFLDPWGTRTVGGIELPLFIVDGQAPIILDSSIEELSRYHLDDVGIGVNIDEDVSWSGLLNLTCRVSSTELSWEAITISLEPSNVFQGRTLFSFNFDFSGQGDPSLLSPEAQLDCWAAGSDDSGWPLSFTSELGDSQPWISIPLSTVGPNIELLDVKLEGKIEAGKELRAEITVKNSGESLQESFNISVYTIVGDEKNLVGLYSQSQIASGQGVVKRVAVTVPDGDWEILVVVDEEQRIWELNEDDNTFTKSYSAPDEVSSLTYILGGGGVLAILLLFVVLRKRSNNELTESKKLPSIEDLPRSGPPQSSRNTSQTQTVTKPKRGPPPKKAQPEPAPVVTNVADAMAKLSLDALPGREVKSETTVPSYESLPPGGDYEYLTEGTFYTGSGIGRWKLEDDGKFTKIE